MGAFRQLFQGRGCTQGRRNLHSCEDSKYLPELGWSLTCAGPEGREEESPKENVEVQEALVHRIPCEKPAGEGGH